LRASFQSASDQGESRVAAIFGSGANIVNRRKSGEMLCVHELPKAGSGRLAG
jgi:hypothetical protein